MHGESARLRGVHGCRAERLLPGPDGHVPLAIDPASEVKISIVALRSSPWCTSCLWSEPPPSGWLIRVHCAKCPLCGWVCFAPCMGNWLGSVNCMTAELSAYCPDLMGMCPFIFPSICYAAVFSSESTAVFRPCGWACRRRQNYGSGVHLQCAVERLAPSVRVRSSG